MTRDVAALILTAMNTCWREPITLPTLLGLLREQQPPGEWIGPGRQLFADVVMGQRTEASLRNRLRPIK